MMKIESNKKIEIIVNKIYEEIEMKSQEISEHLRVINNNPNDPIIEDEREMAIGDANIYINALNRALFFCESELVPEYNPDI